MHNPGGRSERSQRTTIMHIYAAERQRRQAGGAAPAGKQSGQLQPLHRVIRGPHPGRVPDICAAPVTSSTGQAALVADVYREWFAGASPAVAPQDVACCSGTPMAQVTHRSRPSSRPCPTAGQSGAGHRLHGHRRPALVIPLWSVRSREENSCGLGYRLYLQSWAGSGIGTGFPARFNRSA